MIKFNESGHPVFRATSPLPRRVLKSKGGENYLHTSVPMVIRLKLFFAHLFPSIRLVSSEQSQICAKNAKPAMIEQGDLFCTTICPIVCADKCDENTNTLD